MRFCFIDFETNGRNCVNEVITAYLIVTDNELKIEHEEYFEFRPTCSEEFWDEGAEAIHGISYIRALGFPLRDEGLSKLVDLIPEKSNIVCHARWGGYYFDIATFKFALQALDNDNLYYNFLGKYTNQISTHTLYKKLVKNNILPPLKSYTLNNIAKELGVSLEHHHDAEEDTRACYEIFSILRRAEETGGFRTLLWDGK